MQKRAEMSKENLLAAAGELFMEKGYFNTNTKEIVKRAGCSIGNFYYYFSDKGAIYCELSKQYIDDSIQATSMLLCKLAGRKKEDAEPFILEFLHRQLSCAAGKGCFFEGSVFVKEHMRLGPVVEEGEHRIISLLAAFLEKNQKSKNGVSCEIRARMLYVTINEVANDIIKVKDEKKREAYIKLLGEFIVRSVYEE